MIEFVEFELGGRTVHLETGKLARQASGAVELRCDDTVLLGAVVGNKTPRPDIDFFPLTCDYEERFYAVGRIPGSFPRREGRPGEKGILTSRLIDRPIRPLFPSGYRNEVQITVMPVSSDQINMPDAYAVIAASAALTISEIPFEGPIGAVRMGLIDGEFIVNPTYQQVVESDLDLIVAGTKHAVTMVEAGANEVAEDQIAEAILQAHREIVKICEAQELLREKAGKPKMEVKLFGLNQEMLAATRQAASQRLQEALHGDKQTRESAVKTIEHEVVEQISQEFPDEAAYAGVAFDEVVKDEVRKMILTERIRVDGRNPSEIRAITCEVGVLPRAHGSSIFTRGQTQVLNAVALGTLGDAQIIDTLAPERTKRYIHHYNFPSFSVGEARQNRGPGRREIGHGALAERALLPMIPPDNVFPYTIRLVSDVLESNGSSSMASTCASTLSLMDAGVPLKAPVAGIAMGLISSDDNSQYTILTDIQGIEDHCGDMDFKVAGTEKGITALQMDIKSSGITQEILRGALSQAREARLFILEKMLAALPEPRETLSMHAPRIYILHINPERIGEIIGPGGKMIKKIQADTGAKIDIEQDGTVYIACADAEGGQAARGMIEGMTKEADIGAIYQGKVTGIQSFGAFVEILPGKEGLLHISQMGPGHTEEVNLQLGEEVTVRVIDVENGKIRLSRKGLGPGEDPNNLPPLPERRPEGGARSAERHGRGPGGRDRGGSGGRDRGGSGDRGGRGGGRGGHDSRSGHDSRGGQTPAEPAREGGVGATFRPRTGNE
ncbi:MAG TPA: polyribonucleotide nucleotidyltransferase [Armatimonadota bacterium]|nr:polyribonucleotide nucleotidyltransferase [Armatimonadota bacterium]